MAMHSSFFGPDGAVNYDYIVTNSINPLLIGSKCIPNGAHTDYCWANLAHASKLIKNSALVPLILLVQIAVAAVSIAPLQEHPVYLTDSSLADDVSKEDQL